jgi:hypothetical protein
MSPMTLVEISGVGASLLVAPPHWHIGLGPDFPNKALLA